MYSVSIKGIFQAPDGKIVLLLNERNEWELPGGRIEEGESVEQCLAREIEEELGLQVQVNAPVDTYLFEVIPGRQVFIATYACTLAGPFEPKISHEHKAIGLFSAEALPDNLPTGYRTSIERALRNAPPSARHLASLQSGDATSPLVNISFSGETSV